MNWKTAAQQPSGRCSRTRTGADLSLVTTSADQMIGWTEQEVGHWLDDTQLRRGPDRSPGVSDPSDGPSAQTWRRIAWRWRRVICIAGVSGLPCCAITADAAVDRSAAGGGAGGDAPEAGGQPMGLRRRGDPRRTRRDDGRRAIESDQAELASMDARDAFVREYRGSACGTHRCTGAQSSSFPACGCRSVFPGRGPGQRATRWSRSATA